MFIQKLDQLINQKQIEYIPALIQEYTGKMEHPDMKRGLEQVKGDVKMQMHIVMYLVSLRANLGVTNERYISCFNEMMSGFGGSDNNILDVNELEILYLKNYNQYYEPFMRDHSHILENYLVNYVFEKLFPKNGEMLFWEYTLMVVMFLMTRIHLIGISGYYKQLNEETVIKVIQSFNRVTMHSPGYLETIREYFKENEFDSLAHVVAILSTRVAE
ncbi:hypothetical protein D3C76_778800 [compost metagenome]